MMEKVDEKQSMVAMKRKGKEFETFCIANDLGAIGYGDLLQQLMGFVCHKVLQNNGSTKSVAGMVSQIKRYISMYHPDVIVLSRQQEWELTNLIRTLCLGDLMSVQRKCPLVLDHLAQIACAMPDHVNQRTLMGLTMLFMGHDGLMRSGELCSGILLKDVVWGDVERTWCLVYLRRAKCNRVGGGEWIRFDDYGGSNAVHFMRLWTSSIASYGLESPLFPSIRGPRGALFHKGKTISTSWLRLFIKEAVSKIGLDASHYSGHSLRAGGATDLYVARVPYYVIKRKGRWRSDAAMLYYRDDDDVDEAVWMGFRARSEVAQP